MRAASRRRTLALAGIALLIMKKKRRVHSKWTTDWLLKREECARDNLLREMRLQSEDWFNYLRMDEDTYLELLRLVTPLIIKEDTHMRKAVSPHERLTATLRFLATGRSYEELKITTIISPQLLGKIIPETCSAIYAVLRGRYLKFPSCHEEWRTIAGDFQQRFNFPNCLGVVGGKHVRITPPAGSGSNYWNYKGCNSIVLLCVVNANYELVMVHFGMHGCVSEDGILENTKFYEKLKNHELNLPSHREPRNGAGPELPFVFLGDEAFSLREDFLIPYSKADISLDHKLFNYRLSRAQRVVDNVFGILAHRFRILPTNINLKLERIEQVVLACCTLHNFLCAKRKDDYIPESSIDQEDFESGTVKIGERPLPNTLFDLQPVHQRESLSSGDSVREAYAQYFSNEGAVPWQNTFL